MSRSSPTQKRSQPDLVRRLIRHVQASGLAVGDTLPSIRVLAEQLEVTGSEVRDAQIQLQTMGLVRVIPRSGVIVQSLNFSSLVGALSDTLDTSFMESDPSLFHLLDARELIEVECATLAAKRRRLEDLFPLHEALNELLESTRPLDEKASIEARIKHYDADIRFHLAIADIAGNPVLSAMLRSLLGLVKPHLVKIPWSTKRKELTVKAHRDLFEALRSGDVEKVRRCMGEHTGMAKESLLEKLWGTADANLPSTIDQSAVESFQSQGAHEGL